MTRFTLAAFAAISLFAVSGIAHAGEVISDQRYWSNEATADQRSYWPGDAYGYGYYPDRTRSPFNAMASMYGAPTMGSSFVYRGGPKTGTRDYIREW